MSIKNNGKCTILPTGIFVVAREQTRCEGLNDGGLNSFGVGGIMWVKEWGFKKRGEIETA